MTMQWYILQVYATFEDKVKQSLLENAEKENLLQYIEEILIPVEMVKQIKNAKTIHVERKLYPGYVYLKADLVDNLYKIIREIPRVSGFLGANKTGLGRVTALPVPEREIERIKDLMNNRVEEKVHQVIFDIGERVQVIDGPFQSFFGMIEGIDSERSKLKLSISIFNRETPVELDFHQVKKVS